MRVAFSAACILSVLAAAERSHAQSADMQGYPAWWEDYRLKGLDAEYFCGAGEYTLTGVAGPDAERLQEEAREGAVQRARGDLRGWIARAIRTIALQYAEESSSGVHRSKISEIATEIAGRFVEGAPTAKLDHQNLSGGQRRFFALVQMDRADNHEKIIRSLFLEMLYRQESADVVQAWSQKLLYELEDSARASGGMRRDLDWTTLQSNDVLVAGAINHFRDGAGQDGVEDLERIFGDYRIKFAESEDRIRELDREIVGLRKDLAARAAAAEEARAPAPAPAPAPTPAPAPVRAPKPPRKPTTTNFMGTTEWAWYGQAIYAKPFGDWAEGGLVSSALGAGIGVAKTKLGELDNLTFRGEVSYLHYFFDEDQVEDLEVSFSMIPIHAILQLNLSRLYLLGGIGLVISSFQWQWNDSQFGDFSETESTNQIGLTFGGGIWLTPTVMFEIRANTVTSALGEDTDTVSAHLVFGF